MVRGAHEARDLIVRGGIDVIQTDVVLAGGLSGCRRVAALADLHGRMWSPHTWSNGYGLVANLHLALAVSTCPFVEVPYDPPGLAAERRDWLLPEPVHIAADGTVGPPPGPGLGVTPDFDALEEWRVA
jgi:L-alanine-DL-glutamate epimerase-like enolase superfamily enzyme